MSRARTIIALPAALIGAAVLPGSAAAIHEPEPHKCAENGTRVTVDPGDSRQPVSYTHDFAILFACEPYGVYVTYVAEDGSRERLSYRSGRVELTHTEAAPEPAAAPPPAPPAQERKPAKKRKARRACRKARTRRGEQRRERRRRPAARRCKRRR